MPRGNKVIDHNVLVYILHYKGSLSYKYVGSPSLQGVDGHPGKGFCLTLKFGRVFWIGNQKPR